MTNETDGPRDISETAKHAPPLDETKPKRATPSKPATEADLQEVERKMSGFERSTLRWTRASFIIVFATAVFIGLQWLEMRSGGADTHDLAVAAKLQAQKADTISQSMSEAVGELKATADATGQQLGIAQQQAKAAQDSVKAIQRQMRVDQRAWIRPIAPLSTDIRLIVNQSITVNFQYRNLGKTPAKDIDGPVFVEVVKKDESPKLVKLFTRERPVLPHGVGFARLITGVLYPDGLMTGTVTREHTVNGVEADLPLTAGEYDDLMAGRAYLVFFGGLAYRDVFGIQHWTTFCSWYSYAPGIYSASNCSMYNKVDNN